MKERFLRHFTLFDKVKSSKRQTNIERTYNDEKNGKQVLFLGGIFIIAFAIWTALIQMVDVQPLGQNATNIGFATFNCWFHRLTNVNMTIYTITDWMGLIPLVVCLIFAGIGLNKEKKSLQSGSRYHYPGSLLCYSDTGILHF